MEERHSSADALPLLVGARLKGLRRVQQMTLHQVAAEAGLSHSFLSMVERGQADIALSRLGRLAAFYGVSLSDLVEEGALGDTPQIVSPSDGLSIERGPAVAYRLLPLNARLGLQVVHVVMEPQSRFEDALVHRGEDLWWVAKGQVTLVFGDREYRISSGELVSHTATVPHALRNDSSRKAELLAIATSPYW
jgi:transcriptional regulator with XRE-family HTH domain